MGFGAQQAMPCRAEVLRVQTKTPGVPAGAPGVFVRSGFTQWTAAVAHDER